MIDLIDTTEMYLKTIYEVLEEGIKPLRARIVERLGQSGPTVSETVGRMERDGLVVVRENRELEFTEKGRAYATTIMRRHRLAERLLYDVVGIDWAYLHDEACRWEHAMSGRVESRLALMMADAKFDPYGNPIPAAVIDGRAPKVQVTNRQGEISLEEFLTEVLKSAQYKAQYDDLEFSQTLKVPLILVRLGEPAQVDPSFLENLYRQEIKIDCSATLILRADGVLLLAPANSTAVEHSVEVPESCLRHIFVTAQRDS